MTALPLDVILGPQAAAAWITGRARDFVVTDCLAPEAALRLVCERATDGDPFVLASPGQIWRLPEGTSAIDVDVPADGLLILARHADPDRVEVAYLGDDQNDDDCRDPDDELLIDVLRHYELRWWWLKQPTAAPGQTWRRRPDADVRHYPATELTILACYPHGDIAVAMLLDQDPDDLPVTTLPVDVLTHYELAGQLFDDGL